MYLTIYDYDTFIRPDIMQMITDNRNNIRTAAEMAAVEQFKSYLRSDYDLERIFPTVSLYSVASTYQEGNIVQYDFNSEGYVAGSFYTAGTIVDYRLGNDERSYMARYDSTGIPPTDNNFWQQVGHTYTAIGQATGTPPTDRNLWRLGDDRNPLVIMHLIDMVLYTIHSRQSPQNIPQLRADRYEDVLTWLKAVARGTVTPCLPMIETTDGSTEQNPSMRLGGNRKVSSYY